MFDPEHQLNDTRSNRRQPRDLDLLDAFELDEFTRVVPRVGSAHESAYLGVGLVRHEAPCGFPPVTM